MFLSVAQKTLKLKGLSVNRTVSISERLEDGIFENKSVDTHILLRLCSFWFAKDDIKK